MVVVPDGVAALTALAAHSHAELRRPGRPGDRARLRTVGITGSAGKTTAKDLLAAVLRHAGHDDDLVATHGSYNNEIGMPLTVLRAGEQTRVLVLEMGARGPGHVRHLCEVARPDVSLVLSVGSAHLGEFGSREAIAAAKGEIVEALDPDAGPAVAVLAGDDPVVRGMASRTRAPVVLVGEGEGNHVRAVDVELDADARLRLRAARPPPRRGRRPARARPPGPGRRAAPGQRPGRRGRRPRARRPAGRRVPRG